VRVALAEDSALFRSALTSLLRQLDFTVTHAAADGPGLLAGIADDPPDIVILDARMPPGGNEEGFRTAEKVHRLYPNVGILVLSQTEFSTFARQLVEQVPEGVGYLVKDRVQNDEFFRDALFRIAKKGVVMDDAIARQIEAVTPDGLSEPEREVLRLAATGLKTGAIARTMFTTNATVERHLTSIFKKLKIPSGEDHNRRVLAILRWLDAQQA